MVCLLGGIASRDQGKVQAKNRVDCNTLGFWPRVAIVVKFRHWQWGLGERAWACSDVAHSGVEPYRVCTAETVFEEYLNGGRHGPPLPMGQ